MATIYDHVTKTIPNRKISYDKKNGFLEYAYIPLVTNTVLSFDTHILHEFDKDQELIIAPIHPVVNTIFHTIEYTSHIHQDIYHKIYSIQKVDVNPAITVIKDKVWFFSLIE